MYKIVSDVQVTRRKRMSYVFNESEQRTFVDRRLSACIEWVHKQEERRVLLVIGENEYILDVDAMPF